MAHITEVKLHDHTCLENWKDLEEKINEIVYYLNSILGQRDDIMPYKKEVKT